MPLRTSFLKGDNDLLAHGRTDLGLEVEGDEVVDVDAETVCALELGGRVAVVARQETTPGMTRWVTRTSMVAVCSLEDISTKSPVTTPSFSASWAQIQARCMLYSREMELRYSMLSVMVCE